ncbi:hypothetical protein [Escherichia coli]|uniref:hypothetical protein n=1 Tax=Escherichia coli TaxID=562 RepID=UPI00107AE2B4|nr:hypothetical protein [Escherichia coli]EEC7850415.1 hypothetical protein [Escherichia coli]EEQ2644985.1 hypothetical protein [Escherichia coli]MCF4022635.1 hypothetical protein [Escherichia coli]
MIKQAWEYMDAATVIKNAAGIRADDRAALLVTADGRTVQGLAKQLPEELAGKLEDLAKSMMPHTQPERHYTNDAEVQRLLQSLRMCVVQEFIRTSRGEFDAAAIYSKGKLAAARVLTEVHGIPAAQVAEKCAFAISDWRWEVSRAIREANRNG